MGYKVSRLQMNPLKLKRGLALGISALFVLAFTASQPHRVHHFFEDTEHAHHHSEADSNHKHDSKAPAKTDHTECVVQTVSQHCSAITVELATLPIIAAGIKIFHP